MILLHKGGHLFASLLPAADDKAVASSAVGLPPLRTRRTALSSRRGPVSNQATSMEVGRKVAELFNNGFTQSTIFDPRNGTEVTLSESFLRALLT
jgi:hypothetical protein